MTQGTERALEHKGLLISRFKGCCSEQRVSA